MPRKAANRSATIPRLARKTAKRRNSPPAKNPAQGRKAPGGLPAPIVPPLPGQGKRGEQGYLAYLLRQAQAATRLSMERALDEVGVTPPQFVVMTMLRAYPGLSGAELARVALLTPQTVGVIIRNLERDGAIRKAAHPVHGRMLQWTLTRRGEALLARCRRLAQKLERRLESGLSAGAKVTVRRWLSKIATDLQD